MNSVNIRRAATLALFGAHLAIQASPALADAPRQLFNKTIVINWTVDQVARTVDGQSRNRAIAVNQTIFVSSAGRLFTRSSRASGPASKQSEMAPGATANQGGEATGIRFQGNQLVGSVAFERGARQFIANFDASFSSCTVAVTFGRDAGGLKRVSIKGEMLIIESLKATGESCSIRDGNPFASQ